MEITGQTEARQTPSRLEKATASMGRAHQDKLSESPSSKESPQITGPHDGRMEVEPHVGSNTQRKIRMRRMTTHVRR